MDKLRKETQVLEQECGELKRLKEGMLKELRTEEGLMDDIQMTVMSVKKMVNEAKREKDKYSIAIKNNHKILDTILKKRQTLE